MFNFQMSLNESAKATRSYIDDQLFDPWRGTDYEGYRYIGNKQKGAWGEQVASDLLETMGCKVEKPANSGHDRIVDGQKVEMKFSLATTNTQTRQVKNDSFVLNHVSVGKDWEYLLFIGVNFKEEPRRMILTKSKFIEIMQDENQPYFNHQQGGDKIGNDDWMCNGKHLINLIESDHVESLENWKEIIS